MNIKKFKFKNNQGIKYQAYFSFPWKKTKQKGKRRTTRTELGGYCDDPKTKKPKVLIRRGLGKKRELNVTIEEFSHAFFFDKLEKEIRPFATTLTKFLYKNGWRKKNLTN